MKRKLPQWLLDVTTNHNLKNKYSENLPKVNIRNDLFSVNNAPNIRTSDIAMDMVHVPQSTSNLHILLIPPDQVKHVVNMEVTDEEISNQQSAPNAIQTQPSEPFTAVVKMEIKEELSDGSTIQLPASTTVVTSTTSASAITIVAVKTEIKEEPTDVTSQSSSTTTNSNATDDPTTKSNSEDTSSRPTCNYGVKCYRRNPAHRNAFAHPGDVDYRRPVFPNAPIGTPPCPWGAACYRRNPQHFIQLSHPPARNTTPASAMQQVISASRIRQPVNYNINIDTDDEDEDPFTADGDSDEYSPEEDPSEDEDTQEESTLELTDI